MANSLPSWIDELRSRSTASSPEVQRALDVRDRSRTSVLPWRGQFSPQLIEHLLGRYPKSRVLDPFCGSGTVLYEAAACGRFAAGVDVNPAAVTLASFANYCEVPRDRRFRALDEFRSTVLKQLDLYAKELVELDFCARVPKQPFYQCLLLTAFGDKKEIPAKRMLTAFEQLRAKFLCLPSSEIPLSVARGDARRMPFKPSSFDLVVTSPPYINVFNYHQNYRPVMEALGEVPLSVARAEIGANRKHRQNRFLTVIQYCMDMEAVFDELHRVLTPQGRAVFVVGRSSQVRGVSFFNGELIATVAAFSGTFEVEAKEQRTFTNRYGEEIREDILSLKPGARDRAREKDLGRLVGARALAEALESCTNTSVMEEIKDAYDKRASVARSPGIN